MGVSGVEVFGKGRSTKVKKRNLEPQNQKLPLDLQKRTPTKIKKNSRERKNVPLVEKMVH